ncbi:MAG: hypothetical protein ACXVXB_05430 [Nocardioidaceae bacterium]
MAKRSVGVVALAMMLTTTGCAGVSAHPSGDSQTPVAAGSADASSAAPSGRDAARTGQPSAEQLRPALLSPDDLPRGYVVDAAANGLAAPRGTRTGCSRYFREVIGGHSGAGVAEAKVYFKGPRVGTILQESIRHFGTQRAADALLHDTAELASRCSVMKTQNAPGGATTYRISPLPFPELGEATKALAVRVDAREFSGSAQIAVVRRGSTVMRVTYGAISVPGNALRSVMRKAVAKWQAALP